MSKAFLGLTVMLFIVMTVLLLPSGFVLYKILKTENKTIRLAGMALLALGAMALLGTVLGIIIYWFTPYILQAIMSPGAPPVTC